MSDIIVHLSQTDLNALNTTIQDALSKSSIHATNLNSIKFSISDIQTILAGIKNASANTGIQVISKDGALHLIDDTQHSFPWKDAAQVLVAIIVGLFGAWLGYQNHQITKNQRNIAQEKLNLEKFSTRIQYIENIDKCFWRVTDWGFFNGGINLCKILYIIIGKSKDNTVELSASELSKKERYLEAPIESLLKCQDIQHQIPALFSGETTKNIIKLIECMKFIITIRGKLTYTQKNRVKNFERFKRVRIICQNRHKKVWQSLKENEFFGINS